MANAVYATAKRETHRCQHPVQPPRGRRRYHPLRREALARGMKFRNATQLDSRRLEELFRRFAEPWPLDGLDVRVKYTRSTPFSGVCFYRTGRIHVNIGRRNRYPYALKTHIARARTTRRSWWRPLYVLELQDAYQLALFIFLHELYHWLIRKARRNTRQKESRCDRFASRALTRRLGVQLHDGHGGPVADSDWDFQDLDGFVAAAMRSPTAAKRAPRPRRGTVQPLMAALHATGASAAAGPRFGEQLQLF